MPKRTPPKSKTCLIEALYERPFRLDREPFIAKLSALEGEITTSLVSEDPLMLQIHYPLLKHKRALEKDLPVQNVPLQVLVRAVPYNPNSNPSLAEIIGLTRGWPEAEEAVNACTYSLFVSDLLAEGYSWEIRLLRLKNVLNVLQEIAPFKALVWHSSQQVINPIDYKASQETGDSFDPLYGAYNIRLFRVDATQDEYVMDSVGLSSFDLPEVQCHFRELDTQSVAEKLTYFAEYIFEKGDIFGDNAMINFSETEQWRCRREESLLGPERVVLDLDPGAPYAAGDRSAN